MKSLSERERELIILRQLCEMSYGEVAEQLELPSADAAKKACHRALRKLEEIAGT